VGSKEVWDCEGKLWISSNIDEGGLGVGRGWLLDGVGLDEEKRVSDFGVGGLGIWVG
jgi:hypothetical protein